MENLTYLFGGDFLCSCGVYGQIVSKVQLPPPKSWTVWNLKDEIAEWRTKAKGWKPKSREN